MKNDYVCKSRRRAAIELWIKSSSLCNITLCILYTPRDLYTTSTSRLERLLINTNSYIYTQCTTVLFSFSKWYSSFFDGLFHVFVEWMGWPAAYYVNCWLAYTVSWWIFITDFDPQTTIRETTDAHRITLAKFKLFHYLFLIGQTVQRDEYSNMVQSIIPFICLRKGKGGQERNLCTIVKKRTTNDVIASHRSSSKISNLEIVKSSTRAFYFIFWFI